MSPMNAERRGKVVGNGTSGRDTTIDEFQGDGGSVGEGKQLIAAAAYTVKCTYKRRNVRIL